MTRRRSRRLGAAAVVLALVTLISWAFASPIGAAPDDDFHLVSTWCAGPTAVDTCQPVPGSPESRAVPEALDRIECFAGDPTRSAACQGTSFSWSTAELVVTDRGNFVGAYPPAYYAVMGLLSSDDIQVSALAMRLLTVVLFVGLATALVVLLPPERRQMAIWSWVITTIPLGVFIIASNNPSSWAVIGVGTGWMALLGWFETEGRRRWALGGLFILGVIMAAGARGDAALYSGFGIALVLILAFRHRREFYLRSILPVVMGLVALAFFLLARQSQSGLSGFGGTAMPSVPGTAVEGGGAGDPAAGLSGIGLLAYNLLNAPFLWSGALGDWALGWLDTSMPAVVPLATVAAFVALGFTGMAQITGRKAVALGLTVLVLWALPVYVLQAGGDLVGEQVQPRYLLPLVVLLGGLLLLAPPGGAVRLGRAQRFALVAALAGAHFVALHLNLRRYVTGIDGSGLDLGAGLEWWWAGMPGPGVVWIGGSLAYAGLVILLARYLAPAAEAPSASATVDTSERRADGGR